MTDFPYCREAANLREVIVLQCSFAWEALWFLVSRRQSPTSAATAVPVSGRRPARVDAPIILGHIIPALSRAGDPDSNTVRPGENPFAIFLSL